MSLVTPIRRSSGIPSVRAYRTLICSSDRYSSTRLRYSRTSGKSRGLSSQAAEAGPRSGIFRPARTTAMREPTSNSIQKQTRHPLNYLNVCLLERINHQYYPRDIPSSRASRSEKKASVMICRAAFSTKDACPRTPSGSPWTDASPPIFISPGWRSRALCSLYCGKAATPPNPLTVVSSPADSSPRTCAGV